MCTRFAAPILFRLPCNLQAHVSLFLAGEPDGAGCLIDQPERRFQLRSAYEKHNESLSMAAMILTAAFAIPAAAQNQVPFNGTFQGSDTVTPTPSIVTNATGTGTLVGKFSLFDIFTPTPSPDTGQWIAANGDSIYTTFVASAEFGPVVATITEIHTITGGTGRFTGASGSFTVHRMHVRAPSADGTHVTYGWFDGTITPPGATD